MTQKLLTTREVLEILRITKPTLLRIIKNGKLRASKVGHNYRILEDDLNKYIRGETEPKAAAK